MSASSPPLPESFSSAAASSSPGPSQVPPVAGSRSASGIQAAAGAAPRFAQLRAALRSPPPRGVGGGRPAPLFRQPLASPAPPPWPPASLRTAPPGGSSAAARAHGQGGGRSGGRSRAGTPPLAPRPRIPPPAPVLPSARAGSHRLVSPRGRQGSPEPRGGLRG